MSNKQPTYLAFSVKEREGKPTIWTKIGAAFPHEKGDGLNIQLDALPVGDRIVLREPKEKASEEGAEKGGAQ
ncbi:hypothetical protein NLM33_00005 [Bradyrhizobium sp. CCGUVB1N3]|uniref:hypothetical protein n=1 Tax=Bradyrhizobium sp. CCGUVB1N3 TaxID=2949629 RepID=UPI0020B35347|nr:hypothetical protein [Bradyrhizobium sp. CCGUVB1N3]MCP3468699.1 hypothetical protein [Bradyrhizobium sp. CCGUVB1N3]